MGSAIAAVLEAPERVSLREFPLPAIGPNDLLLRVEITGVDGTDANSFKGKLSKELYALQYPRIMGDEVVGFVEAVGTEAAKRYRVTTGDRVIVEPKIACHHCRFCDAGYFQFCRNVRTYGVILCNEPPYLWGGQAEYMYVAPGSRLHKLANDMSPESAVLAAVVLPDGIRWIEKAGVQSGDTVVVLGPGPQGLASTIAAKTRGASRIIVVGTSRDLRRLELAKQFGADHTVVSDQEGVRGIVAALTQNEMADVVIECAGTQETIQLGIDLLRPTGTCVLVGIPTDSPLALSPIRIAKDELTLAGGRSPLPWAVEAAIKLIESGRFAFDRIVSHTFPLRQAEAALRAMSRDDVRDAEVVKVAIKP